MFGVLVKRARAIEDLLVLLIVVALGTRLTDGDDDVVWPAAAILARLGSFYSIMAAVTMVTTVVEVVVIVASVIGAARWAMSARILIKAHFGFFSVGILVGGRNHLANPRWWLAIELREEVMVMESSDEDGDDLSFCDIGNRIPHLGKASDVATEELRRLMVDAVKIMLGARPSTCSHVVVSEDL